MNSHFISLTDISKWNTNSFNDMSYMFYGCSLLSPLNVVQYPSLPGISKWNTSNVTDMSKMFFYVVHYHFYLIYFKMEY